MSARLFTWDWKAQPPMDEIAAAVTGLSGKDRRVHLTEVDTQSDQYAWIVSDVALSAAEAQQFFDDDERVVRIRVTIEPPGETIAEVIELDLGELIGLQGMARQAVIDEAAADVVNNICSWGASELDEEADGE